VTNITFVIDRSNHRKEINQESRWAATAYRYLVHVRLNGIKILETGEIRVRKDLLVLSTSFDFQTIRKYHPLFYDFNK
jgi:hypothetical protein